MAVMSVSAQLCLGRVLSRFLQVPEFKWHIIEDRTPFEIENTGIKVTPFAGALYNCLNCPEIDTEAVSHSPPWSVLHRAARRRVLSHS